MGRPFYSSLVGFFTHPTLGINLGVNGSVTPKAFKLSAPEEHVFNVYSIKFGFNAPWSNSGKEEAIKFMDNPALTNGLLLQDFHNGILDFESVVYNNRDLLTLPVSTWRKPIIGLSNVVVEVYFDFMNSPIIINGDQGDYNLITVRDNLSYLIDFKASARGTLKKV